MKVTYAAAASGVLGGLAALLLYSANHHSSAQVSHPASRANTTQTATQNASSTNGTSSQNQSSNSSTSGSRQTSNTSSGQGQSGANVTVSVGGPVAKQKQQALVNTVQNMLQGNTAKKMDASAFVQYVYAKIGLQLPRTIAEQAQLGSKVTDRSKLQKGDIVCFDLSNKKNTVTFDGIYIGNQNFAAKTTHGLEIISLTNNYWSPKFLYGKRIL